MTTTSYRKKSNNGGLRPTNTALRRQTHILRQSGLSQKKIADELDVAVTTVQSWLAMPCPTEEEARRYGQTLFKEKRPKKETACIKTTMTPSTHERLVRESELQNAPKSYVVELAILLYLDAMDRLRGDIEGPINVMGYRI